MPETDLTLPAALPVFPLTGSLLLPGNWLPLNVFEPRYRNMVADAMEGARAIGMIQPLVPRRDNRPSPDAAADAPELYAIGCAGRIERCEPQPDGRYHVLLKGVSRFRVVRELALRRGYRRVAADYSEFGADREEPAGALDPGRLLAVVRAFGEEHGYEFDLDLLAALPTISLVNGLAAALPFAPAEKQALLEAPGPAEREELLLALMGMGLEVSSTDEYYSPPTLH
jgi:uncharacterized protein